ncbi:MAG: hypothetical protein OEW00_01465 [candidate division Zixibacteria bacterium]|nr:hypothetical protein [candidate division Zixibacteria bacterium]
MPKRSHDRRETAYQWRLGWFYGRLAVMVGAALVISAAIITYFDQYAPTVAAGGVQGLVELVASTLLPYMLSAVVAAITAIGVVTILPLIRGLGSAGLIHKRLREMAAGDLSSRVHLNLASPQLRGLIGELNKTVRSLGDEIADWKMVNRQQWEILEAVRLAACQKDIDAVLRGVDKMQDNWNKIAQIEDKLITG